MQQVFVKPHSAHLTRDTEIIGKMDPYCVCILGTQRLHTKAKNEAGKDPKWEDELTFLNTSGVNTLIVQVWDKDITKDDLVGEGELNIAHILHSRGKPHNETVNLTYKGKQAGRVFLTVEVREIGGHHGHHHGPGW